VEAIVKENVLVEHQVALVGPSTGVARLLNEKNVFPIRASYESELAGIVAHAKAMQKRSIAFLAWNAGAGEILAKAFPAVAAEAGLKLDGVAMFDPSPDPASLKQALEVAMKPLGGMSPDAIVLVAGGNALYEGVRQLRARFGSGTQIYMISSVNWKDLVDKLGVGMAQGIVISQAVPYPYSPRLAIVKAYLERMQRIGHEPSYYSLEGYLGAAVAAEALRKASPNITRSNVTAALNSLGRYEIGGYEVLYSTERRQGFRRPDTTLITSRGTLLR
jgi:ABC-type branched-subunit amino acid transport system substrate-binding protein